MGFKALQGIGGRITLLIGTLLVALVGLLGTELVLSDRESRDDRGQTTRRLVEEAQSLLLGMPHTPQKQAKEFLIPLLSLLSLADVLTLARVGDDKHFNSALGANDEFLEGFLRYALPYLLPEEYAEAADRLQGAAIDKFMRALEKPSDHVPVRIDLA